jgi:hypothetical protein
VNTKAELRLVPRECSWLPAEVASGLPAVLIVKSDAFRTQPENQRACLAALQRAIEAAARKAGPCPASDEQERLVAGHRARANERRLETKRLGQERKGSRAMRRAWRD